MHKLYERTECQPLQFCSSRERHAAANAAHAQCAAQCIAAANDAEWTASKNLTFTV